MKLKFLILLAVVITIFSCTKENDVATNPDFESIIQTRSKKNITIKHGSLEELNAVFIAKGLPAMTLEELGISKKEYNSGQERINSRGIIATSRCDFNSLYATMDWDYDGYVGMDDIIKARRVILALDAPSFNSMMFGYATWEYWGSGQHLSVGDLVIAIRVYLNIITSC